MWPGKPGKFFSFETVLTNIFVILCTYYYILNYSTLFNIIEIIFFYWSNADEINWAIWIKLVDLNLQITASPGGVTSWSQWTVLQQNSPRSASGSAAVNSCCSSPAVHHVCITFQLQLNSRNYSCSEAKMVRLFFFGSAALDRARSQRHILKIPLFINWDCVWCIFITTNEWLKEAWHRALQCSEAEKYYPIYWVLAFTMGIHIDTAQIEFEFPLISDRSFFWRVEKQCSHPFAAWRCLWMVCSRWMRPRMSFVATGVLISSSSLYVYMYYIVLYIIQYNTIRYNNIYIFIHTCFYA